MAFDVNSPTLPTVVRPDGQRPASGFRPARRRGLAGSAAAAASVVVFGTAFMIGDSGVAWADGAHFVPEATSVSWNGAVVTVAFQEAEVMVEGSVTTVAVEATAEVDSVCTRGESTIEVHRSATAKRTNDYPVGEDGTVEGTVKMPLEVKGPDAHGFTCTTKRRSVTTVLEDFLTGATLVHRS
jgi:hypothetical protein